MTKHAPDEAVLKCNLTIEEVKIVESTPLVICDTPTSPKLENKLEVNPVRTGIEMKSNGLETDMPELYDLEEGVKAEKPVKIELDIDLYQMEKV